MYDGSAKNAGAKGIGQKQNLIKHFYSDGDRELNAAAENMGWNADSSRPYRSENNAVVERMVRHVEEGTRTIRNEQSRKLTNTHEHNKQANKQNTRTPVLNTNENE